MTRFQRIGLAIPRHHADRAALRTATINSCTHVQASRGQKAHVTRRAAPSAQLGAAHPAAGTPRASRVPLSAVTLRYEPLGYGCAHSRRYGRRSSRQDNCPGSYRSCTISGRGDSTPIRPALTRRPLGRHKEPLRPDDEVRHRDPAAHRLHRGAATPLHLIDHPPGLRRDARGRAPSAPSSWPAGSATATCNARPSPG